MSLRYTNCVCDTRVVFAINKMCARKKEMFFCYLFQCVLLYKLCGFGKNWAIKILFGIEKLIEFLSVMEKMKGGTPEPYPWPLS